MWGRDTLQRTRSPIESLPGVREFVQAQIISAALTALAIKSLLSFKGIASNSSTDSRIGRSFSMSLSAFSNDLFAMTIFLIDGLT